MNLQLRIINFSYQNQQIFMKKQKRTVSAGVYLPHKNQSQNALTNRHKLNEFNKSLQNTYLIVSKNKCKARSTSKGCNSVNKSVNKSAKDYKVVKQLIEVNPNQTNIMKIMNNKKATNLSTLDCNIYFDDICCKSVRKANPKQSEIKIKHKAKKSKKDIARAKSSRIILESKELEISRSTRPNYIQPIISQEIAEQNEVWKSTEKKTLVIEQLKKINEELRENLLLVTKKQDDSKIAEMQQKHYIQLQKLHFETESKIRQKQTEIKNLMAQLESQSNLNKDLYNTKSQFSNKITQLQNQKQQLKTKIQRLKTEHKTEIKTMQCHITKLELEKKQIMIEKQGQKTIIQILEKKLKDSEDDKTTSKQHLKQVKKDLINAKTELNGVLDENLKLKEKEKKNKEEKVYMKSNLEVVLATIRNNLKSCEKIDPKALERDKNVLQPSN